MDRKYFPINTKTACQLKWSWSTIRLNEGTTSSCHRVRPELITPSTFEQFHNTPKKLLDRATMLQGKWPQGGCEYCQQLEQVGNTSDRQMHLQIPNLVPPELDNNINAVEVSPRILEIYFNNTCNLSCVYCYDGFSSKIEQENIKFGEFNHRGVVIKNTSNKADGEGLTKAFWSWFAINCHTLVRLHVLGGEPFYQDDFYRCLDFFEANPCPDLEFNVISNMTVASGKFQLVIEKIKKLVATRKIKRFDLTASIDSFGPEQEYVRHGINLQQWKENFEYVVQQKWVTLNINQTLTGLILKQVPELLQYINRFRQDRKINHYFSLPVYTHNFLQPGIFGPEYFDEDFEKILSFMPATPQRDYMQSIQLKIKKAGRDDKAIQQLVVFLDEIDRRRNLNWKQVFPWVLKESKNVV